MRSGILRLLRCGLCTGSVQGLCTALFFEYSHAHVRTGAVRRSNSSVSCRVRFMPSWFHAEFVERSSFALTPTPQVMLHIVFGERFC